MTEKSDSKKVQWKSCCSTWKLKWGWLLPFHTRSTYQPATTACKQCPRCLVISYGWWPFSIKFCSYITLSALRLRGEEVAVLLLLHWQLHHKALDQSGPVFGACICVYCAYIFRTSANRNVTPYERNWFRKLPKKQTWIL